MSTVFIPDSAGTNFTPTTHTDIYSSIDPTKTNLSQPEKVVLITGAGRGIGRSIALRYAEAGVSTLILAARTQSQLDEVETTIKSINASIIVHKYTLDVTDSASVRNFANHVTNELKISRLDILINNAGKLGESLPITATDETDYWQTVEVNLKGPYLMLKNFLDLMVKTSKELGLVTNVINITSIGAVLVLPGWSSYQVSKLALLRLGEFVKTEYGDKGINCIGVHPGGVDTELAKGIPAPYQGALVDTPELAGGFVVWLTSGEARTWLNGRYVSVNWDVEELEGKKKEIVEGDKLKVRLVV